MSNLSWENRVIAIVVLLALCAMLLRVGWVIGGSEVDPYAFAQDDLQTEEESQQIAQEQERVFCEDSYDSQEEAQSAYENIGSIDSELASDFDSDGDGIACELVFGEQGGSSGGGVSDGNGSLMQSGGSEDGPMPPLPNGGCPDEFPISKDGACFTFEVR